MAKKKMSPDEVRSFLIQKGYTPDEIDASMERIGVEPSLRTKVLGTAKGVAESPLLPYLGALLGAAGGTMVNPGAGTAFGFMGGKVGGTAMQEGLKNILNAIQPGTLETNKDPMGTFSQASGEGLTLGGIISLINGITAIRSSGKNINKLIEGTPGGPKKEQVESNLGKLNLKKFNLKSGQPEVEVNPNIYKGGVLSPSDIQGLKPKAEADIGSILARYPQSNTTIKEPDWMTPSSQPSATPTWPEIHGYQRNAQSQANYGRETPKPENQLYKNFQTAYSNIIKEGIPGMEELYKQYERGQRMKGTAKPLLLAGGGVAASALLYKLIGNLVQKAGGEK